MRTDCGELGFLGTCPNRARTGRGINELQVAFGHVPKSGYDRPNPSVHSATKNPTAASAHSHANQLPHFV